jgi:hypothetical protein
MTEFDVLTTRGRLRIAADSQSHANALAIRDGYTLDYRWAPFTEYEADEHRILGSIQQSGRFLWATDTRCPQALKDMIKAGIVTFKGQNGIIAEYIPLVAEYKGFQLNKDGGKDADSFKLLAPRGNA